MRLTDKQIVELARLMKISVKAVNNGFRITKDGLGVGSKYDVGVNAKEIFSFPEELHGNPPVIFATKREAFDVLSRLIRYAAQTILIRGAWAGLNIKDQVTTIIKS